MKANRNDSCPCGSGKKFKKCCEGKSPLARTGIGKRSGIAGAVIIVIAAVGVAAWLNRSDAAPTPQALASAQPAAPAAQAPAAQGTTDAQPAAATTGTPSAQPPGQAPPGKVWSAAHGHWHDSPLTPTARNPNAPNPIQVTTSTMPVVPGSNVAPPMAFSQPSGPAPPGKVWSVAHGHWHDAPPGAMQNAIQQVPKPVPQPPGPAPAGKVWSTEHGHWHDRN